MGKYSRLVYALVIVVGLASGVMDSRAARLSAQGVPDLDPRAQQITALVSALNQEREKTQALAESAANLRAELQRTRDGLAPACIAAIEKANDGKTVNPMTLVLSDKPKPEPAKPEPKKKDGRSSVKQFDR